jgi:hypothetical protein
MDRERHEHHKKCEHDANVMCTNYFLDHTTHTHLDRQRLHAFIDGKQHWSFAITPECGSLFLRLRELCLAHDVENLDILVVPLAMMPIFVCISRDKLALSDLTDLVDFNMGSREAYESKEYIAITSLNVDVINQALSNWIYLDHLLS